jgi:H2-forming N5,N10-methylenetetrahydromethanopterin dehydrogenase-like enzyme
VETWEITKTLIHLKNKDMDEQEVEKILKGIEKALEEIENLLRKMNDRGEFMDFSDKSLVVASRIFLSVIISHMVDLCEQEKIEMEDCEKMAISLGDGLGKLIKVYTDKNIVNLCKNV